MMPVEEKVDLPWTQMKVYFPLAGAKRLIPANAWGTPHLNLNSGTFEMITSHAHAPREVLGALNRFGKIASIWRQL
jgi:hypothetical protein